MNKTVTVLWYGQMLQGELVEMPKDGTSLDSMLGVRIMVQGVQIVALFHPNHVYASAEELIEKTKKEYSYPVSFPKPEEIQHPQLGSVGRVVSISIACQRKEQFKAEHWDHEHNHLKIESLDKFYQIWREEAAEKQNSERLMNTTTTQEPKRIVSDSRLQELKKQLTDNIGMQPTTETKRQNRPQKVTELSLMFAE
jgi:hypothetical protein